jgi:hypothetical protein
MYGMYYLLSACALLGVGMAFDALVVERAWQGGMTRLPAGAPD